MITGFDVDRCPFCGIDQSFLHLETCTQEMVRVRCGKCGARGPTRRTPEDAVAAWGKRTLLQLVRDSRVLIARFTAAKSTPVHDSIVVKCERALDDVLRTEVAYHERRNKKSVRGTKGRQT